MKIVRDLQDYEAPPRLVATLGNFDGVHLGHRAIFRRVVAAARNLQGTAAVITFEPHPLKLLAPERAPLLINTYRERERLIAASCIDLLVALPFTRKLAALPAGEFVEAILVNRLRIARLIVGYDYAFGRNREGDIGLLRAAGQQYGFAVEELAPIAAGGEVYSSSRIRRLLLAGEVAAAATLLGRHFSLEGEVVHGAGRGRGLGYPTANIRTDKELLPHPGVYAVKVRRQEIWHDAVVNIGRNPTFDNQELTIEAHLFDIDADLYGETLRLYFVARLRDEIRFPSIAALCAAIRADVEAARAILSGARVIEYREYLDCGASVPTEER